MPCSSPAPSVRVYQPLLPGSGAREWRRPPTPPDPFPRLCRFAPWVSSQSIPFQSLFIVRRVNALRRWDIFFLLCVSPLPDLGDSSLPSQYSFQSAHLAARPRAKPRPLSDLRVRPLLSPFFLVLVAPADLLLLVLQAVALARPAFFF